MSFTDHFLGSSLDSRWTALTGGGGTVTVTDSYVECKKLAGTDVAAVYYGTELNSAVAQTIAVAVDLELWGTGGGNLCRILNKATPPVADTAANWNTLHRFNFVTTNAFAWQIQYVNSGATVNYWAPGSTWTTTATTSATGLGT